MKIDGIILAAGSSSRMGSTNKLLLQYKNHTIIEEVLGQLVGSTVDEILIVNGFEKDRIEDVLTIHMTDRMKFLYNERYHFGRAESIKCAIRAIIGHADAALFMVGDKPRITSTLINKAINRFKKDQPAILYVETPAGRGHPIIFSKSLFDQLLLLQGDRVGDDLVASYRDKTVVLQDDTPQIDIDNQDDYRMLLKNEISGKEL